MSPGSTEAQDAAHVRCSVLQCSSVLPAPNPKALLCGQSSHQMQLRHLPRPLTSHFLSSHGTGPMFRVPLFLSRLHPSQWPGARLAWRWVAHLTRRCPFLPSARFCFSKPRWQTAFPYIRLAPHQLRPASHMAEMRATPATAIFPSPAQAELRSFYKESGQTEEPLSPERKLGEKARGCLAAGSNPSSVT